MKIKNIIEMHRECEEIAVQYKQKSISYKELFSEVNKRARLLEEYRNEIVILFMENSIDYYISYFAVLNIDSVIVPVNTSNTVHSLNVIKSQTGSRLIITNNAQWNRVQSLDMDVFLVDTNILEKKYQSEKPFFAIPDETIMLIETSGSLSESKLVMLTNENIFSNITAFKDVVGYMGCEEKAMIVSFLGSSHGNTVEMLFYLYYQISVVLYDGIVNMTKMLRLISFNEVTRVHLVSPLLMLLCKMDREIISRYDLSKLHRISFGSSIFSKELLDNALERFPNVKLIQDYGLTEASPLVASLGEKDWLTKFGSLGKILSGIEMKIDIVDEESGMGELLIKGKNVCKGYFKSSNSQLFEEGWLRTGDLVRCDKEGYLFFVGRKGRRFKCNGYNINPEDIEKIVMTCRGVKKVLVYAEKDVIRENCVCMDIEIDKESKINEKMILSFCTEFLPPHKMPQKINIVDKIECTATGKVKAKVHTC